MASYEPSALISAHWRFILGIGFLVAVISMGVSLLWPLEYQAQARVLITPSVSSQGEIFDQFTALKSAEQMGKTLTQVTHTTLFQNRVIQAPYDIQAGRFEKDPRKRRKEWAKKVSAEMIPGSGVLVLSVFDEDVYRAEQLAQAVAEVLVMTGAEYLPGRVDIRIVDPPIVSRFPMRPNVLLRALVGLVFGVIIAMVYALSMPHNKQHDEFRLIG